MRHPLSRPDPRGSPDDPKPAAPDGTVLRTVGVALALVAGALLAWQLTGVLLLLFAAVLVAVLLRALADPLARRTPLPDKAAVAVAALLVGLLLTGFVTLLGAQVGEQAAILLDSLPRLVSAAEDRLGFDGLGEWFETQRLAILDDRGLVINVASYSASIAGAAAQALVVAAAGVYLALAPGYYRDGLLMLVPDDRREGARGTLDTVGRALRLWLLGQLAAMALVGVTVTVGLWLLGVPSALALGVIAGLLEFVPYIGPVASAAPAIAVALGEGSATALWVAGLYLLVQQAEGILITPLVQQHTVDLPPVVTIFAIVAFGLLLGPLGYLLATPLAVVCLVLVKKLWVRDVLDEPVSVPGEEDGDDAAGG